MTSKPTQTRGGADGLFLPAYCADQGLLGAFFAPLRTNHWQHTLVAAVWMAVLSWLVIPTLLLCGYLATVIRAVARDEPIPPGTGWLDRAAAGVTLLGATLLLVIPAILLAGTTAGTLALVNLYGTTNPFATALIPLTTIPLLGALYLLPAVFVRAARTNTLRVAWSRTTIRATATPRYLSAMVIASILGPALLASWIIPVLGPFLWSVPYVIWLAGCSSMFAIATPGTRGEFVHPGDPGTPVPADPAQNPHQPVFSDQYR